MYEHKTHPPISHVHFLRRVVLHAVAAAMLVLLSLAVGMAGYSYFEQLTWRDAFLNAAMLMGGMGPVNAPVTDGGKLFAGLYALYAGLIFLLATSLILAPVVHRVLHKFHWQE